MFYPVKEYVCFVGSEKVETFINSSKDAIADSLEKEQNKFQKNASVEKMGLKEKPQLTKSNSLLSNQVLGFISINQLSIYS